MKLKALKVPAKTSLQRVIVVPFLLQLVVAIGLTSWFAFRNGQRAVNNALQALNQIATQQIQEDLNSYLQAPYQLNQILVNYLQSGVLAKTDPVELERYLFYLIQNYPRLLEINLGTQQRELIGVKRASTNTYVLNRAQDGVLQEWSLDSQGNPVKLIQSKLNYDPTTRPWYQSVLQTHQPRWSEIYTSVTSEELGISASQGIYNTQGKITEVVSISVSLKQIGEILQDLEIGKAGQIFILERNGLLVASSNPEHTLTTEGLLPGSSQTPQRLLARESPDVLIQQVAQQLATQINPEVTITTPIQLQIKIEDQPQLVQVTPFSDGQRVNWLVVLVIPQTEFHQELNAAIQRTILLGLGTLGLVSLLGISTSRWITQPLQKLLQASQGIAQGKLDQTIEVQGIAELEDLSHAFNQMSVQLKTAFESLESQVEERTAQLRDTNKLLREEIQDHKQTEAKVIQALATADAANQAKSQFLANMSHELRTPLNAILGFAQLMNRDASLSPDQRQSLNIINSSGQNLLELINDILDLSKIEAGRISLEESSFDLYQLLEVLQQTFHLKANLKGLTLKLACAPNVPQFIKIDEGKLRQVLINLLGNAIKFTENGEVILNVSVELGDQPPEIDTISRFPPSELPSKQTTLKFQISDTGPGISPEEQKQLFHAFVQTETGQRSQQGSGLGLTISQKFVQLMGGQITLNSTVGVGTTFQFTLSVIPTSRTEIHSRSTPRVSGLALGQPQYRILVVDDVATNRQLLVSLLTSVGFQQVQAVENGLQAIECWESWQPHLIWMDMRMPVMDGYEATRQIKATLKEQSTVIIALTADALEQQQAAILASGCDDIVLKPFQEEVIFAKMAEYLGIQYTDEESKTLASPPPDSPPQQVTPEDLHLMSAEWQAQLYQAAIIGNDCRMQELVAQIPEDQAAFAAALNYLIEQFEFEQIIHLTQA